MGELKATDTERFILNAIVKYIEISDKEYQQIKDQLKLKTAKNSPVAETCKKEVTYGYSK